MSTSSSSAAHKKLDHVIAVAEGLKRQVGELQALREKVERTERSRDENGGAKEPNSHLKIR